MEDPSKYETEARGYIERAYAQGGEDDTAVLARLAQAEALLAIAAANRPAGRPGGAG